jgi:hypothetical protein
MPSFKLKNGVITSLLMYLIAVLVSRIRLKQQQKKIKERKTKKDKDLFQNPNVRGE